MHQYNTSQKPVIFKEYGRNIQKIVEYVTSIKNKKERNDLAKPLIELMKQLNPTIKESYDYYHKLWNQLYIMSDFKIDVDSKYDMEKEKQKDKKPKKMEYNINKLHYKHYGRNIELLIENACNIKNKDDRNKALKQAGCLMKTFFMNYNKDFIDDELILEHIKEISGNKVEIDIKKEDGQDMFSIQNRSFSRNTRSSRRTPDKRRGSRQ